MGEAQDLELMTTKTQDPQDLSAFQVPATTGKQKFSSMTSKPINIRMFRISSKPF